MTVSVVILTRNEAKNIERCIKSVLWADEVIVVDAESEDETCEIAQRMGARVIVHPWEGGGKQADFAISQANSQWVLIVDADEVVSIELADAVRKVSKSNSPFVAYKILRVEYVLGKWLKHGGFYPHYEIRLFKHGHVRHDPRPVHRKVIVDGPVGRLNEPLFHYSSEDFLDWWRRNLKRAQIEAEWDFINGKRFNPFSIYGAFWKFFRRFILKAGFLDGWAGFFACSERMFYIIVKQACLFELQQKLRQPTEWQKAYK
ncbi:MAG: glycosyltransferase family 2 protein [Armatimonadetes bacterium]|nr:glycosyltransferase family 2 protein [Armatimonadota bacterium]MDW8029411.1 glycosyltransferase family 2 protein [Armatimonadota bacterium]